ncbi:hypothetical protein T35B1_18578 [Salinisphaera shabanensis T35B1]|uniref:hypothetical protein n=1 Tax=Salinisphaera shabanensis TaxID=180542 RepID=UPI00333FDDA1
MLQWNLKELREYIRAERANSDELIQILRSIDRYIQIFMFHLEGARDAMDEVIDPTDEHQVEAVKMVFGASAHQERYYFAKVASEAHVLGAAHSARAMFDVFAFLVNGLLLNGAVCESRCNLQVVAKKLPPSPLKRELDGLANSYWFGFVSAFVNVAKHRMLVDHSFRVGFKDPHTGIRIGSFEYKGQRYPQYRVSEFLEGVLEVKNKVVDCGDLLNKHVVKYSA